jgi:cell division protein FtsI/penicillin-binding protein 2
VPTSRSRTRIVIGVTVVLLLAAAAVPAAYLVRQRLAAEHFRDAVAAFATAWHDGHLEAVPYRGATGADVAKQAAAVTAGLTPAATDLPAAVEVASTQGPDGGAGSATLRVRWDLGQNRNWQYDTSVALVDADGAWRVTWTPAVVHPSLTAGQTLTATGTPAVRGRILGAGGQVLVTDRPVVVVGIQPGRAKDRRAAAAAVAAVVDVDAAELTKRVVAAAPSAFVDVITLREPDYQAVRDRLQPIPGAVFQRTTRPLAPTAGFARALLGTVGPATKEIVDASKGRIRAGDVTGLSGVQRRYDAQLAGTAGLTVRARSVPAAQNAGQNAGQNADAEPEPLFTAPAANGADLTLTLDQDTQVAAEAALARSTKPAALVAIRASTGDVLAVANGPAAAAGYNRALIGRYPPGSTFKVVTSLALLQNGVTPNTPVPCPATINVGGRNFRNAEGEVLGTAPFHRNFADSCNTAFIGAARKVSPQQLHDAAAALGYGAPNRLGVDAFAGDVPAEAGAVEHAADAIGQGKVLASPLTVAAASAAVAAGHFTPPRLVVGTQPADPAAEPSPSTTPDATPAASEGEAAAPLPQVPVTALRALMAEVVTSGTGTALRGLPGGPVHAKTGTAEFGSADPPETHAWITGYQGDVAFAVVVDGGGFGGKVAAPLAADFLRRLAA